jgi:hypothetical protein
MAAVVGLTNFSRANDDLVPAFELKPRIEGIEISIPVRVDVSRAPSSDTTNLRFRADLAGVSARLNEVVEAIWQKERLADKRISHRGTIASVENGGLRLKLHFHARPSGLPSSNGSVVLLLNPVVADDGIGLSGHVVEFNVSNDITRNAVKLLRLDDRLRRELTRALTDALAKPDARFVMPAIARAFGARVTAASFGPLPPGPALLIEATTSDAAIGGLAACLLQNDTCPQ